MAWITVERRASWKSCGLGCRGSCPGSWCTGLPCVSWLMQPRVSTPAKKHRKLLYSTRFKPGKAHGMTAGKDPRGWIGGYDGPFDSATSHWREQMVVQSFVGGLPPHIRAI